MTEVNIQINHYTYSGTNGWILYFYYDELRITLIHIDYVSLMNGASLPALNLVCSFEFISPIAYAIFPSH